MRRSACALCCPGRGARQRRQGLGGCRWHAPHLGHDAGGNVRHSPAMELLGLQSAGVIAYLGIASNGAVTLWPTDASDAAALAVAALSADERLHLAPNGAARSSGDDL